MALRLASLAALFAAAAAGGGVAAPAAAPTAAGNASAATTYSAVNVADFQVRSHALSCAAPRQTASAIARTCAPCERARARAQCGGGRVFEAALWAAAVAAA
jgi:hypothetical protein